MGSRLCPLVLTAGALLAYETSLGPLATYLVLLAVPAAAAAAFCAVAAVMEGKDGWGRAVGAVLALTALVAGAAVGSAAPVDGRVPPLAISSLVAVLAVYALPAFGWLLAPFLARPRRTAYAARDRVPRDVPAAAEAA